jgi:SSS family solute:Na+ symporter
MQVDAVRVGGISGFITVSLLCKKFGIPIVPQATFPFMMTAFYLCMFCVLLQVLLSFIFPVIHTTGRKTLYWQSWLDPLRDRGWSRIGNYKLLSFLLLVIMVSLYYLFQ